MLLIPALWISLVYIVTSRPHLKGEKKNGILLLEQSYT